MENKEPIINSVFAESNAVSSSQKLDKPQIDILRESNRQFKLEIIELKEKLNKIIDILK